MEIIYTYNQFIIWAGNKSKKRALKNLY